MIVGNNKYDGDYYFKIKYGVHRFYNEMQYGGNTHVQMCLYLYDYM